MITAKQREQALLFKKLHQQEDLFVLPNIWNGGSGKVFEKNNFPALATTSAGVAYSLGYEDGESVSFDDLLWVVQQIAAKTKVPVSVDFERGYGEAGSEVKQNAKLLLEAGAVGVNIEDGLPDQQLDSVLVMKEKLLALSALKQEMSLDFVINARTDVYWNQYGAREERLALAIERCNQYIAWGADCVFIPGTLTYEEIAVLVREINGPLNIILSATTNDVQKLNQLGVKRLSLGSAPARYALTHLIELAGELKENQWLTMLDTAISYQVANQYFFEEKVQQRTNGWGYQ